MNRQRRKEPNTLQAEVAQAVCKVSAFSNAIDMPMYVIDPQTHVVLFANKKAKGLFGESIEGKKCFRALRGKKRACSECAGKSVLGKNLGKAYTCDYLDVRNKRSYKCIYNAIRWPGKGYVKYALSVDVTEQKRMEDALKESEELFRSIVQNTYNATLILNDNFRIVYANKEAENLSGYLMKEIVGQDFREFVIAEDRDSVAEPYLVRRQTENVISRCKFRIIRKDGEERTVGVKTMPLRKRIGEFCTVAQVLDLTNNTRIEQERKRFEECLSALNVYGQRVSLARSMSKIYKLTLDAMQMILGFEYASILMTEGNDLCLRDYRGYSTNLGLRLPLDTEKGITVRVAKTGKPAILDDVTREPAYVKGGQGIHSELAVPLKIGNRALGVLNVESEKLAAFGEEDRKLLEILASHATIAISDLRRRGQLKEISQKMAYLMRSTTQVMHVKQMRRRLEVIANAIQKFGWRRVVISLRNENLEGTDLVSAGLTKEEDQLLRKRRAPGYVWKERLGPKFSKFTIGGFYYLPWSNPWIREHVHGVPRGALIDNTTTYAGVPSRLSKEEMVDWHPQDMLYAPLLTPEGRVVGILSMDDPTDGRKPTEASLTPLELFLHQAAIVIENAQLVDGLKEAREMLEQKVEERTRELRESQEQLLKAQRLAVMGELAGMVGHDLRNPLTSIAGAAYYIRRQLRSDVDTKALEMLTLIEKNIIHSNKIINDLLDYSREMELEFSESTPKAIVREMLSLVEIPRSVRLVDLTENEPIMRVDCENLKRAFANVVKNAFDAMPKAGTLTITSKRVEKCAEFTFSDTGVGIAQETMAKLWTPLFTTKAKGMGFGLPICKRIIEAHGGSISVESMLRKGTTFTVTVPIEPKAEEGGEKVWVRMPESSLLTTTRT